MKKLLFGLCLCVSTQVFAQPKAPVMKNEVDSFSYALGVNVAKSVKDQGIDQVNPDLIAQAFMDVMKNTPGLTDEQCINILQQVIRTANNNKLAAEKKRSNEFLENNKKRKGVVALPNGLQYEVITAGDPNGPKPTLKDTVKVDYVGTLIDGTEFDNSIKRGQPIKFNVTGVIPGWTQILQMMTPGSKWKVYIPSDLAYGDQGAGGQIPGGAALVFEIILHKVFPAQ